MKLANGTDLISPWEGPSSNRRHAFLGYEKAGSAPGYLHVPPK